MCVYLSNQAARGRPTLFVPELSIMKPCDITSHVLSFNFSHFYKSLSERVGVSHRLYCVDTIACLEILPIIPVLKFGQIVIPSNETQSF